MQLFRNFSLSSYRNFVSFFLWVAVRRDNREHKPWGKQRGHNVRQLTTFLRELTTDPPLHTRDSQTNSELRVITEALGNEIAGIRSGDLNRGNLAPSRSRFDRLTEMHAVLF